MDLDASLMFFEGAERLAELQRARKEAGWKKWKCELADHQRLADTERCIALSLFRVDLLMGKTCVPVGDHGLLARWKKLVPWWKQSGHRRGPKCSNQSLKHTGTYPTLLKYKMSNADV